MHSLTKSNAGLSMGGLQTLYAGDPDHTKFVQ